MYFTLAREDLLRPLHLVNSVVERRQTLPILSHVLMEVEEGRLTLHATDLEVGLTLSMELQQARPGTCTMPARKWLDIVRALPEGATVDVSVEAGRASLRSGSSRFTLASLPVQDFPRTEEVYGGLAVSIAQRDLRVLLERTYFCMAQQDVRYYLNGMLLEASADGLRAVATDGHRLAVCDLAMELSVQEPLQLIIPRKAVAELLRLLEASDAPVHLSTSSHHIRFALANLTFYSKLVDGRFPDYERVIPLHHDKMVRLVGENLRDALLRVAILTSDQSRTVRLHFGPGRLAMFAHNLEQEEAEEELEVEYEGGEMEIGFNAGYLLDVLAAVGGGEITLALLDPGSSCLIRAAEERACRYVVMPMRI